MQDTFAHTRTKLIVVRLCLALRPSAREQRYLAYKNIFRYDYGSLELAV